MELAEIEVGKEYVVGKRHPCAWLRGQKVRVTEVRQHGRHPIIALEAPVTIASKQRVLAPSELSPLPSPASGEGGEEKA